MKMKFEVTEHDIRMGEVGACNACPIALAVNRGFNALTGAFVRGNTIHFRTEFETLVARTPMACFEFMDDFDSGQEVKPFSFELDFAQEWVALNS